ncbi:hypothetical protein LJC21_01800 [Bacteroides sp. OttesenSCG-928-E20]|nr:hypothetical protein [Bacteroides sp. OttesenSCG-928-E20]MDL2304438.1 hypothetical protein [Bacteroides sp. OttesenSCG-928-D19]
MKNYLFKTVLSFFVIAGFMQHAVAQTIPDKVVEIIKEKVVIRTGASNTASELETSSLGKQYELINTQGNWLEIKDPISGKTGFVASSAATVGKPTLISSFLKAHSDNEYQNRIDAIESKGYEQTYTYSLYEPEKEPGIIYSTLSDQYANTQGQMNTSQFFYKGKNCGWYIVLNKELDMGGEEIGDVGPLVFYKALSKPGFYYAGVYFEPVAASLF